MSMCVYVHVRFFLCTCARVRTRTYLNLGIEFLKVVKHDGIFLDGELHLPHCLHHIISA